MVAQVQKQAPKFEAKCVYKGKIQDLSLDDYKGKYVVLFWYPMDFTFVCPTEIIAFNDAMDEFKSLDCQLIAASCDSEYVHQAWINTPRHQGGLGPETHIPIISDTTHTIAKQYGVYLESGITLRGLFIIDTQGIIRQITINDLPVGRNVTEIIRLVEAFQFTDKHGQVCPADWNRGSKAISLDREKAKAYFADDD
ncbi:putative cytosolic thioredoxin peroxidase [Choanephora cucurbitarum]|nr:putative cytosolic thioredoxin peroxidase [Choanephora cucurbitarum]